MKRLILQCLFVCLAAVPLSVSAQTVTQIGTGTQAPLTNSSIYSPICRFSASSGNDCSRSNLLYTDVELAAAGITAGAVINKIGFFKIGTGASTAGFTFEIHMRNSTTAAPLATTTWATILTTHTPVYVTTTEFIPATTGWIDFTLTTPFVYTGQNLEIAMSYNMTAISGNPTTGPFDWQYTTGFQNYIIGQVSTSPPASLNGTVVNYKVRPNIQFDYTPAILPIKLTSFTGDKREGINRLMWTTASEDNNAGFEIQRSVDGLSFTSLGFVAAKGEQSSGQMQHYSFEDARPEISTNYYRLKQIDRNDKFEFSKTISIAGASLKDLKLIAVYPNPVKNVLRVKLEVPVAQQTTAVIIDAVGKLAMRHVVQLSQGEHDLDIPVSGLSQGSYYIRIECQDGRKTAGQFFIKK